MPRKSIAALLAMILMLCSGALHAQTSAASVRKSKKATALVRITTTEEISEGSAFCIDTAGLFITNAHVVEDVAQGGKLSLVLNSGETNQKEVKAIVLRDDKDADLALLKIVAAEPLTALELGDIEDLVETTPVTAFGYPFGSDLSQKADEFPSISVNLGHITAMRKSVGVLESIQLDASLNPGSSGGPVIDTQGKVIGVVKEGIIGSGINFAIPVSILRQFLSGVEIVFTPPVVTPADEAQEREFQIGLKSAARPNADRAVTLILTAANQEPREFPAKKGEDGAYIVRAVPAPPGKRPHILEVKATVGDKETIYHVKAKDISVGMRTFSLNDVVLITGGKSPGVGMKTGQEFNGEVSGLRSMELIDGATPTIDLSGADRLLFQEAKLPNGPVSYRILVKEAGHVVTERSGTLPAQAPKAVVPAEEAQPVSRRRGVLIVSADEWPTSDSGYSQGPAGSAERFVSNLAAFFAGTRRANFLVYSNHWTFRGPFQDTLRQAGHRVTMTMTPDSLEQYDAVFVGGTEGVDRAALAVYLSHGGNIYIAGGTGMPNEVNFWNEFLKPFGMEYIAPTGFPDTMFITNFAPGSLFNRVEGLMMRGPNPINLLPGAHPRIKILSQQGGYNWWVMYSLWAQK